MPINLQNIREKVEVEAEIDGTVIEPETGDRPDVEIEINQGFVVPALTISLSHQLPPLQLIQAIVELTRLGENTGYLAFHRAQSFLASQQFKIYAPATVLAEDVAQEIQRCFEKEHGLTVGRKILNVVD